MDLFTWIFVDKFLPTLSVTAMMTVATTLIRWGLKVDRGLTAQATATEKVVSLQREANLKVISALDILVEKLNGHATLDDERHNSQHHLLEAHEQRLQSIEREAFRGR